MNPPVTSLRLLLVITLLAGCANRIETPKGSLGICWSANTRFGLAAWTQAAERDLGGPVLLLQCHASTNRAGVWTLYPDDGPPISGAAAAWFLHRMANGRICVLIACNEAGTPIDVPDDVYYPRQTCSAAPWVVYPGWVRSVKRFARGALR